jgi:hypothetical protein
MDDMVIFGEDREQLMGLGVSFRAWMRKLQESLEAGEIDEDEAQSRSQARVALTLITRARRFRASNTNNNIGFRVARSRGAPPGF